MVLLWITITLSGDEFKNVLYGHSWKVTYWKTINGTNDPRSTIPASQVLTAPPFCGQILTFKNDSTCIVENRGKGMFSGLDNMNWYLDDEGAIIFRNKGRQFRHRFALRILSYSDDSIRLYQSGVGIHSGELFVNVYKLTGINKDSR